MPSSSPNPEMPSVLRAFLFHGVALDPTEAELLWRCLPLVLRQRILYQVDRLVRRRPRTAAGDDAARRFIQTLNPRELVEACEQAVVAGVVSRGEIVVIQEKLFAEMTGIGKEQLDILTALKDGDSCCP